jgi:hypothetical protein
MRSDDGGTTWRKTDGTALSLPVTASTGEVVMEDTLTVPPNLLDIQSTSIVTDANNRPWMVVCIGSPRTTYLWNFDGTYWNVVDILPVMQQFYPYPGGYSNFDTVVSITAGGELYLFTSFNPEGVGTWATYPLQTALLSAPVADVAAAAFNNQTPAFELTMISPPDPTRPNCNCSIERNVGHNPVNDTPSLLYQVGDWVAVNSEIRYVDGGTRAVTIEGTVTLQDYPATPAGVSVDIVILSGTAETHTVTLDATGHYSFMTALSGSFDVTAKASHWLKKKVTGVVLGTNPVNFTLINGDCNNDNAVNSADLTVVLTAMDTTSGGPADLDGDLEITSTDLAIVLSSMNLTGD